VVAASLAPVPVPVFGGETHLLRLDEVPDGLADDGGGGVFVLPVAIGPGWLPRRCAWPTGKGCCRRSASVYGTPIQAWVSRKGNSISTRVGRTQDVGNVPEKEKG